MCLCLCVCAIISLGAKPRCRAALRRVGPCLGAWALGPNSLPLPALQTAPLFHGTECKEVPFLHFHHSFVFPLHLIKVCLSNVHLLPLRIVDRYSVIKQQPARPEQYKSEVYSFSRKRQARQSNGYVSQEAFCRRSAQDFLLLQGQPGIERPPQSKGKGQERSSCYLLLLSFTILCQKRFH